ncbi:MAG: DoxX family membrane protein [Gemmatimonadaceae bacterium]|nr:DoxX family membrane protein [Gemmatimonadaceae bacterium]
MSSTRVTILRIAMGLFLAAWGADKLLAVEGSVGIFARFYGVEAGPMVVRVAGIAEIALAALLIVDWWRAPVAWAQLALNVVSAAASWRQILDPWGLLGLTQGGTHLFLASIVVTAASVVLVLCARDGGTPPRAPKSTTTPDTGR